MSSDTKPHPQGDGETEAKLEHPAPSPSSDIPDGGFHAYLQVLGAHLLFFNSW